MTGSDNSLGTVLATVDVSRYDLVLTVIPLAFLSSLLAANVLSVSVQSAVAVASVVGGLAVVDALFVNPPATPESGGE